MSVAKMTNDQLVDLVGKGIETEFKHKFEKALREFAASYIEALATEVAKSVTVNVMSYHRIEADKTDVRVQFNYKGVEQK